MDKNIDLVSSPKKSFWKLSIPLIAFCFFDSIYGVIDMVWISRISIDALYALGISMPVVSLVYGVGESVGRGTNSMMSRFLGSGDYDNAYNTLIHGIILGHIIWIIIIVCLLLIHDLLIYVSDKDAYFLIFDYLLPIGVFAYILIYNNIISETLQAEGNSSIPTTLMVVSNIVNIILDPIFIFNLNLGLKGAAYATLLSSFVSFVPMMYLYLSGRTKIPMSLKYFRFRSYIFVEILKVAFPNFLDKGLWAGFSSFINYISALAVGPMGPILFSVADKIRNFMKSPTRGSGKAFASVTGHLFGARKFDELYNMFKYVIKVSLGFTLVEIIALIFLREYAYSLFSVTGMETEIFWIAIALSVVLLVLPLSVIVSGMLDGFGKSMYSMLITVVELAFEAVLIYLLYIYTGNAASILIGICVGDALFSAVYFFLLKYFLAKFKKDYAKKSTVREYSAEDKAPENLEEKIDNVADKEVKKFPSRIPMILSLIAMTILFLRIIMIPIQTKNTYLFISGAIALIISSLSTYNMFRYKNPITTVAELIIVSVIIITFIGYNGYFAAILFIVAGLLFFYMNVIGKKLKK